MRDPQGLSREDMIEATCSAARALIDTLRDYVKEEMTPTLVNRIEALEDCLDYIEVLP